MHRISTVIVLALAIFHVAGRKLDDVPQDPSLVNQPSAIIHSFGHSEDAQYPNEDARGKMPLVERWRQWVRRQDTTETSGDETTTEDKSETQQTTEKEETTTETRLQRQMNHNLRLKNPRLKNPRLKNPRLKNPRLKNPRLNHHLHKSLHHQQHSLHPQKHPPAQHLPQAAP
jgi:hypothetical protein